ncbi:type VII secretion-associated serine protease mycosin [Verrucosispora sp. ts21]|uniref:type VII secretion-associated serine protease mycosin n=1 Tax=Verrucosispora sp. ts21 TaxID=2069341 RepID=UPI000C883195|nr:type VII secretion-associated serine protease mycosin [Verrucosispora sp. ts21]PMR59583.1 type VII secretion-associated serine protease mycosin [Verrucosispora sp. ts21]
MRVLTRPTAVLALSTVSALALLTLPAAPALADSTRDNSWHVKALELPELHKITQGEGVVVAVVDTGVDAKHRDLKNNLLPGADLYDDDTKGGVDRVGHGTGMASLIAGHGHGPGGRDGVLGVAPKAKILPVTIKSERSPLIAPTALAAGINWAIDNGADIINVSLGSSFNEELDRAVARAYQRNVVVVAAVGNREDMIISNPARHPATIAVNGTDRKGVISKEAALPAEEVSIAAPGEDIVQAAPGDKYVTSLGSSSSAALVSGAMALVKSKYPDLNAYELFERLLETARDAGDPGRDLDYGWGVLDLRTALTGEPDGRASPRASAPPSAQLEPWQVNPREREDGILIFVWAAILVVLVGGGVATVWMLRDRSRRRQAALADDHDHEPVPVGTALGDGPPNDPGQPAETTDDVWRRPPG